MFSYDLCTFEKEKPDAEYLWLRLLSIIHYLETAERIPLLRSETLKVHVLWRDRNIKKDTWQASCFRELYQGQK
jgi:hypothetical protein